MIKFITSLIFTILICCSPIINKVAFKPDKSNYYNGNFETINGKEINLLQDDGVIINGCLLENDSSDKILLYFQGQGSNYSGKIKYLKALRNLGINLITFDYRSYGKSTGRLNEKNSYIDGELAYNFVVDSLGFTPEKIFIAGRSLGTSIATYLSKNRNIRGCILIQPLTTGREHVKFHSADIFAFAAGSSYNNLGRISMLECPLLVIHGTEDNVIPYRMGKEIYETCKTEKILITIEGADHENIDSVGVDLLLPSIGDFIKN